MPFEKKNEAFRFKGYSAEANESHSPAHSIGLKEGESYIIMREEDFHPRQKRKKQSFFANIRRSYFPLR